MNESYLLKLSLLISILGLIALFLITKNIEINDTTIEKITNEEIKGDIFVIIPFTITSPFIITENRYANTDREKNLKFSSKDIQEIIHFYEICQIYS